VELQKGLLSETVTVLIQICSRWTQRTCFCSTKDHTTAFRRTRTPSQPTSCSPMNWRANCLAPASRWMPSVQVTLLPCPS